jgi:hypothetical protein
MLSIAIAPILLAACGGDSSMGSMQMVNHETLRCTSRLSPSTVPYQISGDVLTVGDAASGQAMQLSRVATGSSLRPLFGTWQSARQQVPGLESVDAALAVKVDLVPDRITVTSECTSTIGNADVSAMSPAQYSDSAISILGADTEEKDITN